MFGDGISLDDLITLLRVIREHHLTLQVKITDKPWEDISPRVITKMVTEISAGVITGGNDIRLRLFTK